MILPPTFFYHQCCLSDSLISSNNHNNCRFCCPPVQPHWQTGPRLSKHFVLDPVCHEFQKGGGFFWKKCWHGKYLQFFWGFQWLQNWSGNAETKWMIRIYASQFFRIQQPWIGVPSGIFFWQSIPKKLFPLGYIYIWYIPGSYIYIIFKYIYIYWLLMKQ